MRKERITRRMTDVKEYSIVFYNPNVRIPKKWVDAHRGDSQTLDIVVTIHPDKIVITPIEGSK